MAATTPLIRSRHAADNGFVPRPGFEAFDYSTASESLVERLESVARRRGDATALVDGAVRLSYADLIGGAAAAGRGLAHHLAGRPGLVAVSKSSGRAAVEGMLAVLFAGLVYLCLPVAPDVVVDEILDSASPAAVVSDGVRPLPAGGMPPYRLADLRRAGAGTAARSPVDTPSADDLACVFATSGTTGTPKLVGLSHRAVVFDIGRQTNDLFLGPDDRIDLLFDAAFSASLSSVFSALLTGAELHIGPAAANLMTLGQWLSDSGITISTMTVSTMRTVCAGLPVSEPASDALARLRLLSVGGEAVLERDVRAFHAAFPASCVLQNAMASTETRTYTQYFVRAGVPPESPVPIGWPVYGKDVAVVDPGGTPVAPGETGEIVVRSRFLADGYVNDPALTSVRFARQPDGSVIFRTGDHGRFRDDGCLIFIGRGDALVKIRGYRVETGAVEHALLAERQVRAAAVIRVTSRSGEDSLAAFVVPEAGAPVTEADTVLDATVLTEAALREQLHRRLPAYAVPSAIRIVPELPLNRNRKVDYRRLSDMARDEPEPPAVTTAADRLSALSESWGHALDRQATPDDDFFALGGDSMSAIRLQLEIHRRLGLEVSLATLLRCPTPRALAGWLEQTEATPTHAALVPLQSGATGVPLFCMPGIAGMPLGLSYLAEYIGPDRPVYGLRATVACEPPGAEVSIEAIARHYLDAIDTVVDPEAPVHLCGHSFGSFVALEMAHQLGARGRPLGAFVIIDTPLGRDRPGGLARLRDTAANLPGWLWYDFLRASPGEIAARALGKFADLWRGMRPAAAHGGNYPDLRAYFGKFDVPPEMQSRVRGRIAALRRYVRRPLPGTVVLFRSRAQALMGRSDRCLGWDDLAASVEVHDVPGHHDSCTQPPHVKHLGTELARRLRAADQQP